MVDKSTNSVIGFLNEAGSGPKQGYTYYKGTFTFEFHERTTKEFLQDIMIMLVKLILLLFMNLLQTTMRLSIMKLTIRF